MEGVLVSKTNKVWSSALSVSKANVSSSFKGFAGASKNILHDRSSVHKQRHISTITDNTKHHFLLLPDFWIPLRTYHILP